MTGHRYGWVAAFIGSYLAREDDIDGSINYAHQQGLCEAADDRFDQGLRSGTITHAQVDRQLDLIAINHSSDLRDGFPKHDRFIQYVNQDGVSVIIDYATKRDTIRGQIRYFESEHFRDTYRRGLIVDAVA